MMGNKHDLGQSDGLGFAAQRSHFLTVGPSEHELN